MAIRELTCAEMSNKGVVPHPIPKVTCFNPREKSQGTRAKMPCASCKQLQPSTRLLHLQGVRGRLLNQRGKKFQPCLNLKKRFLSQQKNGGGGGERIE